MPAIDLEILEAPAALPPPVKPTLLHVLSNREAEVLSYALAGHKPRQIASRLGIKGVTVYTTLENIRKKARDLVGEKEKPDGQNIQPMD